MILYPGSVGRSVRVLCLYALLGAQVGEKLVLTLWPEIVVASLRRNCPALHPPLFSLNGQGQGSLGRARLSAHVLVSYMCEASIRGWRILTPLAIAKDKAKDTIRHY